MIVNQLRHIGTCITLIKKDHIFHSFVIIIGKSKLIMKMAIKFFMIVFFQSYKFMNILELYSDDLEKTNIY